MSYPEAEQNPDFPQLERNVLKKWAEDRTFEASIAQRQNRTGGGSNEYVFYDGPPFANGLPHYGHLATGFVKDIVPRYQTMRGNHVERRFGWDCHGLPAELEVEREIGVHGRNAIIEYGIDRFNTQCRESVLKFAHEWESYVTRQARWVDFKNDYKTMDLSFMESVIWAFKELWNKGLVYEGHRVVPYSWAAQTPLSNFETRLDNSFRERDDPALTVTFETSDKDGGGDSLKLMVWTTTPWTLPSNLALCVHKDIDYAIMERNGERWVLADMTVERYAPGAQGFHASGDRQGRRAGGSPIPAAVSLFRHGRKFVRRAGGRFRHRGGWHRHRPHRSWIRRGRSRGRQGARPADRCAGRCGRRVYGAGPRLCGPERHPRGQRQHHQGSESPQGRRPSRAIPAQLSALLANRPAADLYGDQLLVRGGEPFARADGRAEQRHSMGAGAHQGRLVRQLAGERPRLERVTQPFLGHPDPGLAKQRSGTIPASTFTGRSTRSSAISACVRPTCTGPSSTSLLAQIRTIPPASPSWSACRTCSTAGSSRARCRSRSSTIRSKTRSASRRISRATSSSSTWRKPAAGSTP